MKNGENRYASDTQLVLAKLYRLVSIIGLSLIAAAFVPYVSGILETSIPVQEVSAHWHLDAQSYAESTGTPVGWAFIKALSHGDSLSFGSLVFMGVAVIVCLAVMVFAFLRKRKPEFAIIALLQIVILVIAATGIASGS